MTAYVDDMLMAAAVRNGDHIVRGRWSHLMADSSSELHTFAARLGLRRAWVQKPGTPMEHYDVTAAKRAAALRLGAVPIAYGEGGHLTWAKRCGVPFDLQLLREDPDTFQNRLSAARAELGGSAPLPAGPVRLQLSRARGWRLPEGAVSVAHPTRWTNPFRPQWRTPAANAAAVEHYRDYLARNPALVDEARAELTGLNLACWCAPSLPCHADILLAIANPAPQGDPR